jgi:hypothetical protein
MAETLPYDPRIRKIATKKAEKTLKKYLRPSKNNPRQIYVVGECPRCSHEIDHTHRLVIVAPKLGPAESEKAPPLPPLDEAFDEAFASGDVEFSMSCDCRVGHPKTPVGKEGCGSRFKVHVSW